MTSTKTVFGMLLALGWRQHNQEQLRPRVFEFHCNQVLAVGMLHRAGQSNTSTLSKWRKSAASCGAGGFR